MFEFIPRQIPQRIVVVGCGGTGSRLVPMLAQFIRSITREFNPRGWLENPVIYLIDDDVVEQKNLLRQNFIESDVGKHKAIVLAQRYSRAYGIRIIPSTHRVGKEVPGSSYRQGFFNGAEGCPTRSEEISLLGQGVMFLLCVDSASARRDILSTIETCAHHAKRNNSSLGPNTAPFIIDAGNEDNFGQVQFFSMVYGASSYNTAHLKKNYSLGMTPHIENLPAIPYPKSMYANMQDNQGGSCADLDQTLAINAAMATTMLGIVQNFYYVKPMRYNRVGISLDGGGATSFNTLDDLIGRIEESNPGYVPMINIADVVIRWHVNNRKILKKIEDAAAAATKPAEAPIAEVPEEAPKPVKKTPKKAPAAPELVPLNRSSSAPAVPLTPITRADVEVQPDVAEYEEEEVDDDIPF
jgi:hypothetical protein